MRPLVSTATQVRKRRNGSRKQLIIAISGKRNRLQALPATPSVPLYNAAGVRRFNRHPIFFNAQPAAGVSSGCGLFGTSIGFREAQHDSFFDIG